MYCTVYILCCGYFAIYLSIYFLYTCIKVYIVYIESDILSIYVNMQIYNEKTESDVRSCCMETKCFELGPSLASQTHLSAIRT